MHQIKLKSTVHHWPQSCLYTGHSESLSSISTSVPDVDTTDVGVGVDIGIMMTVDTTCAEE